MCLDESNKQIKKILKRDSPILENILNVFGKVPKSLNQVWNHLQTPRAALKIET